MCVDDVDVCVQCEGHMCTIYYIQEVKCVCCCVEVCVFVYFLCILTTAHKSTHPMPPLQKGDMDTNF